MWNDNETDIDLLGFEYLVDSLEILLSEPAMLPLTVGVLGDWGSGKSSLMNIAMARLDRPGALRTADADAGEGAQDAARDPDAGPAGTETKRSPFITVAFSPWRFEDYSQVKLALMTAVLDAVEDYIGEMVKNAPEGDEKSNAIKLFERVKSLKGYAVQIGIAGLGPGATALGIPVGFMPMVNAVGQIVLRRAGDDPAAPTEDAVEPASETLDETTSIAKFHKTFEGLLKDLSDVQAVVVFIDDMDRCTTDAIIDTFEAIRLFLHAPKTAYVLGLNEPIITAALEERYPDRTAADDSRGQQYLEKMIQARVSVPHLSEPEVLAYVTLLYAERHTTPDDFAKLLTVLEKNRTENPNGEAMNEGIVIKTLFDGGDVPEDLAEALRIASSVGGPLARGLRGNPRQIKRFLTTLELRRSVAERRGLDLDSGILAKLMVLEETSLPDFETIYHWQVDQDGIAPQLGFAETYAKRPKGGRSPAGIPADVKTWAGKSKTLDWLKSEPPLAGKMLSSYFTFSRDRLTTSVRAARLSPEQQKLLTGLRSEGEFERTAAVTDATALEDGELAEITSVLWEYAGKALTGPEAKSLVEIAEKHPSTAASLFADIATVPKRSVPHNFVLKFGTAFRDDPRIDELLTRWDGATGDVSRAVQSIRRAQKKASS